MRPALALIPLLAALFAMCVAGHAAAAPSLVGSANATIDVEAMKVLYDNSLDKSVLIILYKSQYGTGWLLAPHHDVVVTAAHVVDYNRHASVVVLHGGFRAVGHVVALDREHDVAVIRLEKPWDDGNPLPLCLQPPVKGATILVIGYPLEVVRVAGSLEKASENPRAAFGMVAWLDRVRQIFEFQATTDQGNSGGPVIDSDSFCVYGLVSFALRGSVGVTYYATDVEAVKAVLRQAGIEYRVVASHPALEPRYADHMHGVVAVAAAAIGGLLLGALLFTRR